jgi:hypothetical protein
MRVVLEPGGRDVALVGATVLVEQVVGQLDGPGGRVRIAEVRFTKLNTSEDSSSA